MPALPLTATQQAPLQSLFASSPFDAIADKPSTPPTTRPRSASVCQPPAANTLTSHTTLSTSSARRASTTTSTITPTLPLASLTFSARGQCRSVTLPNPTTQPLTLHLTTSERKLLRAKGFRLPDVKSKLTIPARSERPLVVVWEGLRGVENGGGEEEVVGRMVVHELRLQCASDTSLAVVIRLSATVPLSPSTTTAPSSTAQRRPLQKLTDWLSAGFNTASTSPKHSPKVDLFSTAKKSRTTRSHSTSITATHSTASSSASSAFSTPPSPTADDEWSSPRHASEPPVLSPLHHQHCYTLSTANVYTRNENDTTDSPSQPVRKLSSERHSRSFSFAVQSYALTSEAQASV